MPDRALTPDSSADVVAGLRVSCISVAWTLVAGTSAVIIGSIANSLVLIAFGAVGLFDAVGSGSLIAHFRHALHHQAIVPRHERLVLLIVTLGMAATGVGTLGDSVYRLAVRSASDAPAAGAVIAGTSAIVLTALARRKHRIARRIPSHALRADGWLSAVGAVLAVVALAGTAMEAAFGWWWSDPLAAAGVATGALGLSASLARNAT
jgi:divalent metal cation (Fe/Co/Zn/Cd) transporter